MNIDRITIALMNEPARVRSVGISVWDILRWLASGMSEAEIISEHPGLEHEDFLAVYGYAAMVGQFAGVGERMREIRAQLKQELDPLMRAQSGKQSGH
jgi:uncharacterized protein (DUF433 family)